MYTQPENVNTEFEEWNCADWGYLKYQIADRIEGVRLYSYENVTEGKLII